MNPKNNTVITTGFAGGYDCVHFFSRLKNGRKNGIIDSGKKNHHYETQIFISCLLLLTTYETITTTYRETVEFLFPILYNVTAERRKSD